MKYLKPHWKFRLTVIFAVSLIVSLLVVTLEQTNWAEQINLQGYAHGEGEGNGPNFPAIFMYILPFVKEIVLIGVPMLFTVFLAKLLTLFTKLK